MKEAMMTILMTVLNWAVNNPASAGVSAVALINGERTVDAAGEVGEGYLQGVSWLGRSWRDNLAPFWRVRWAIVIAAIGLPLCFLAMLAFAAFIGDVGYAIDDGWARTSCRLLSIAVIGFAVFIGFLTCAAELAFVLVFGYWLRLVAEAGAFPVGIAMGITRAVLKGFKVDIDRNPEQEVLAFLKKVVDSFTGLVAHQLLVALILSVTLLIRPQLAIFVGAVVVLLCVAGIILTAKIANIFVSGYSVLIRFFILEAIIAAGATMGIVARGILMSAFPLATAELGKARGSYDALLAAYINHGMTQSFISSCTGSWEVVAGQLFVDGQLATAAATVELSLAQRIDLWLITGIILSQVAVFVWLFFAKLRVILGTPMLSERNGSALREVEERRLVYVAAAHAQREVNDILNPRLTQGTGVIATTLRDEGDNAAPLWAFGILGVCSLLGLLAYAMSGGFSSHASTTPAPAPSTTVVNVFPPSVPVVPPSHRVPTQGAGKGTSGQPSLTQAAQGAQQQNNADRRQAKGN